MMTEVDFRLRLPEAIVEYYINPLACEWNDITDIEKTQKGFDIIFEDRVDSWGLKSRWFLYA